MSLPDQTPRLPKLPFLLSAAVLLFVIWIIVDQSRFPLTEKTIVTIAACALGSAILTAIPFITDYARRQDEALDERQRGLEALSRTVNTAAEQISIAANGLNEITDLMHKNLKQAEQLPQKLQEKIAEFKAQLENARDDEREDMEKELAELRSSESERLQATVDRIHKDLAELTKLEAAIQKHVSTRADLVNQAAEAITKAQTDTAAMLNESIAAVSRQLAAVESKAVAEIEARLDARTSATVAAIEAAAAAAAQTVAASVPPPSPVAAPVAFSGESGPTEHGESEIAVPPRKPRKSRREEQAASGALADTPTSTEKEPAATTPTEPAAESTPVAPTVPEVAAPATPPAAPAEPAASSEAPAAAESTPVAPAPAEPAETPEELPSSPAATPAGPAADNTGSAPAAALEPAAIAAESAAPAPETAPAVAPAGEPAERPARKRQPRKAAADAPAELPLDLGPDSFGSAPADDDAVSRSEVVERVISSDGATRLIVTAYIGIGNRIFIRGEGPGLSWEKGVPLQFVSIGKWRWENMDASAPIECKLYKNDEVECASLGRLTLEPGHQQEVTAKF